MINPKVALLLRISQSLKARLSEIAKREHRSLNQQIEFFLDACVMSDNKQEKDMSREAKKTKSDN
jgi:hypothetical protein